VLIVFPTISPALLQNRFPGKLIAAQGESEIPQYYRHNFGLFPGHEIFPILSSDNFESGGELVRLSPEIIKEHLGSDRPRV
jgi:hypothetical protein